MVAIFQGPLTVVPECGGAFFQFLDVRAPFVSRRDSWDDKEMGSGPIRFEKHRAASRKKCGIGIKPIGVLFSRNRWCSGAFPDCKIETSPEVLSAVRTLCRRLFGKAHDTSASTSVSRRKCFLGRHFSFGTIFTVSVPPMRCPSWMFPVRVASMVSFSRLSSCALKKFMSLVPLSYVALKGVILKTYEPVSAARNTVGRTTCSTDVSGK